MAHGSRPAVGETPAVPGLSDRLLNRVSGAVPGQVPTLMQTVRREGGQMAISGTQMGLQSGINAYFQAPDPNHPESGLSRFMEGFGHGFAGGSMNHAGTLAGNKAGGSYRASQGLPPVSHNTPGQPHTEETPATPGHTTEAGGATPPGHQTGTPPAVHETPPPAHDTASPEHGPQQAQHQEQQLEARLTQQERTTTQRTEQVPEHQAPPAEQRALKQGDSETVHQVQTQREQEQQATTGPRAPQGEEAAAPARRPSRQEINESHAERLNEILPQLPGTGHISRVVPDHAPEPLGHGEIRVSDAREYMRMVSAARKTPTGREALDRVQESGSHITMEAGGSFRQGDRINIDPSTGRPHDQAGILAHEAHHAATYDKDVNINASRDQYVHSALRNEAEAQARVFEHHREAGPRSPDGGKREFGAPEYHAAYDRAAAEYRAQNPGASPEQIHQHSTEAGTKALQQVFGQAVPSTSMEHGENGELRLRAGAPANYEELYGSYHDQNAARQTPAAEQLPAPLTPEQRARQNMTPEEALLDAARQGRRGVKEDDIRVVRENLRGLTQEDDHAFPGARNHGDGTERPKLTREVMDAQMRVAAALHEDVGEGSIMRKFVPNDRLGGLLHPESPYSTAISGDVGLARNSHGLNAVETIGTLGLDYEHYRHDPRYMADNPNGRRGQYTDMDAHGNLSLGQEIHENGLHYVNVPMDDKLVAGVTVQAGPTLYKHAQDTGADILPHLVERPRAGRKVKGDDRSLGAQDNPYTGTTATASNLLVNEHGQPHADRVNQEMSLNGPHQMTEGSRLWRRGVDGADTPVATLRRIPQADGTDKHVWELHPDLPEPLRQYYESQIATTEKQIRDKERAAAAAANPIASPSPLRPEVAAHTEGSGEVVASHGPARESQAETERRLATTPVPGEESTAPARPGQRSITPGAEAETTSGQRRAPGHEGEAQPEGQTARHGEAEGQTHTQLAAQRKQVRQQAAIELADPVKRAAAAQRLGLPPGMPPEEVLHEFLAHDLAYKDAYKRDESTGQMVSNYDKYEHDMLNAWGLQTPRPSDIVDDPRTGFRATRFDPIEGREGVNPVVAFRGTAGFQGIRTDMDGQIGRSQYNANRPAIDRLMNGDHGKVVATGHSLGGSHAQQAGNDHLGDLAGVSTFQAPGIDAVNARSFNQRNAALGADAVPVNHHFVESDMVHRGGEQKLDGNFYAHTVDGMSPLARDFKGKSFLPSHVSYLYNQPEGKNFLHDIGESSVAHYDHDTIGERRALEAGRHLALAPLMPVADLAVGGMGTIKPIKEGLGQAHAATSEMLGGFGEAGHTAWAGARDGGSEAAHGLGDMFHGRFREGMGHVGNGLTTGTAGLLQAGQRSAGALWDGMAGSASGLTHSTVGSARALGGGMRDAVVDTARIPEHLVKGTKNLAVAGGQGMAAMWRKLWSGRRASGGGSGAAPAAPGGEPSAEGGMHQPAPLSPGALWADPGQQRLPMPAAGLSAPLAAPTQSRSGNQYMMNSLLQQGSDEDQDRNDGSASGDHYAF